MGSGYQDHHVSMIAEQMQAVIDDPSATFLALACVDEGVQSEIDQAEAHGARHQPHDSGVNQSVGKKREQSFRFVIGATTALLLHHVGALQSNPRERGQWPARRKPRPAPHREWQSSLLSFIISRPEVEVATICPTVCPPQLCGARLCGSSRDTLSRCRCGGGRCRG